MKSKRTWMVNPPKPPKPKVPDSLKQEVQESADQLIENVLKPRNLQPPPENPRFNFLSGMYAKWFRSYFYFYALYTCPPDALAPGFEAGFARLEYVGNRHFNLAFMRHTGQWWQIYADLPLEEALALIRDEPHFTP